MFECLITLDIKYCILKHSGIVNIIDTFWLIPGVNRIEKKIPD